MPLKTPLHAFHTDHNAKFVDYAGWEMPISYGSIQDEHRQTRTSGGIFDVSHMGRLRITGLHARRLLERVCSRKISDMTQGQCRYSLVCNEQGGVRDDVIVSRFDEDEFLVVCNAANRAKIVDHLASTIAEGSLKAKMEDETEKTAMVALQGPRVMDLLSKFSREVPSLKRYRFAVKNLMIVKIYVARTGYTGEDGVEVILPGNMVGMVMKLMLSNIDLKSPEAILRPVGLGARDSLRLEAGMPLYGHELGEQINALSCGVDFAISMNKHEDERGERFIGQDALEKTRDAGGPERRLVGLELDGRRTARQGMPVMAGGTAVGEITSGCWSPTLEKSIAMALVHRDHTSQGTPLQIDAERATLEAKIVPLPFYARPK